MLSTGSSGRTVEKGQKSIRWEKMAFAMDIIHSLRNFKPILHNIFWSYCVTEVLLVYFFSSKVNSTV